MSSVAERPRRADAIRNRDAVIRAAATVFAEKGMDAGVPEIAALAGVGKATVYRSFRTKEHLVAAVACERLDWMTGLVAKALSGGPAGPAFEHVLQTIAERQACDCAIAGSMAADIHLPELDAARARTKAALGTLMERAQAEGAVRPDATSEDLRVLFTGVADVLRGAGQRDPEVWRRYARLIADALRAR
jgi:AcrR family transcriptional regulator